MWDITEQTYDGTGLWIFTKLELTQTDANPKICHAPISCWIGAQSSHVRKQKMLRPKGRLRQRVRNGQCPHARMYSKEQQIWKATGGNQIQGQGNCSQIGRQLLTGWEGILWQIINVCERRMRKSLSCTVTASPVHNPIYHPQNSGRVITESAAK